MLTTPTSRISCGARPARKPRCGSSRRQASTWGWTERTATRSSIRTPTTRYGSPTPSCRRSSTEATGNCVRSPTVQCSRRAPPGPCSARSPKRPGSAPTPACSSTPPSTTGTPPRTRVVSRPATRAPSTCTSTTRHATWPASTCWPSSPTRQTERPTASTLTISATPSRWCLPPRRSWSATPTIRPRLSPRPPGPSGN